MHIVFRTDASLQIGTGHVMRCLTLADSLRERGSQSTFICRPHTGHLQNLIQQRGHSVTALAPADDAFIASSDPSHAQWLGTNWYSDSEQTRQALGGHVADCLVVDHYALDRRWEQAMRPLARSILVIDDLADRPHHCDLLLDQNLGRRPEHYKELVPPHCQVLTGSRYALLRPEFSTMRAYSMERRKTQPALRQLLITMGGVDQPNATGKVLQVLKTCALPIESRITVVMGLTAPWLKSVKALAAQMPWPTLVVVNINDMAQRMADSDLAIGAAGSSSWERCCLGLPSILVILADNQNTSCAELGAIGAAEIIGKLEHIEQRLPDQLSSFLAIPQTLKTCSDAASSVCDGTGTTFVVNKILSCANSVH
jgi:UDP-2,4-diacetamido-2,4,6-trideoxy-beta-L-altropyranose hydrolase